jgi:SpoVK/Ycf46/Vps4 family AAA+-type ATPase
LEALKKSREGSKESLGSPALDADAPTPPPHGFPITSSSSDGPSNWIGGGSIPPMEYSDLGKPPPLPMRPAMAPRKSSGTNSIRDNELTKTASAATLVPGASTEKKSRTPSPEKKGRMLRTLRPGRDGKVASKMPSSLRSKPEASKAATQAWGFGAATNQPRPGLGFSNLSTTSLSASARSSMERTALERPNTHSPYSESPQPQQPQAPFYTRAGESSTATSYTAPPSYFGGSSEPRKSQNAQRPAPPPPPPPIPRKSVEPGKGSSSIGTAAPLPSYRKEYPTPTLDPRTLAMSAAARSRSNLDTDTLAQQRPRPKRPSVPQAVSNSSRSRNVRGHSDSEPLALGNDEEEEDEEDERRPRPPPPRKGRARGDSIRADLPPTPTSEPADSGDEEVEESDDWKRRTSEIMKNLPRGVDKQAAQQILNEIVIQGDEVHWDDVAGLEIAKSALKETVVYPFLRPDLFMGLREPARGMLLFGPPGTGKTMLARAVATESKSTFFAISASSLTSKFLGESEKLVRALFQLAKMLAPSIIFVDEIDSLLSARSGSGEHEATRRIKTEFLIQWSDLQKAAAGRDMSDKEKEKGDATRVLVLAATNLPWAIDEAARRRFVRRQYIPLPEDWVRKKQVQTLLSHQKHELDDSDLDRLVTLTESTFTLTI